MYAYAGNNPVKYTDPDGRFEIDDESQTIYCNLNNLIDLKLASIVFQKNKNIKQCVAFDKKSDYQLTFTDKDQFKRIVDSNLLNAFSNVFSKVSDGVSLAQGIENIKGIEVAGNVVTGISVVSDSIQTVKNLNKGNKYGAASSAVDMGIDVIGFFGPEGAYFSVVLKYSKKGTEFGISELAKASVYLEREIVNEWTNTLFGVKFK